MESVISLFSNIYVGKNRAFIYFWVSKSNKFIYVGQTNDKSGTLGRAVGHLRHDGTFRKRCEEKVGVYLEKVDDLTLYSFPLPSEQKFIGAESSYREAIEYLVQSKLILKRGKGNPMYLIISWVRTSDRTNESIVQSISENIVNEFLRLYSL